MTSPFLDSHLCEDFPYLFIVQRFLIIIIIIHEYHFGVFSNTSTPSP